MDSFIPPASLPFRGTTSLNTIGTHLVCQLSNQEQSISRRSVLKTALATSTAILVNASTGEAASTLQLDKPITKEIAELASKIPGYGQPDIDYPEFFLGTWQVERKLVGLSGSNKEMLKQWTAIYGLNGPSQLPETVKYTARYVNHRGRLIADREFNVANLMQVECKLGSKPACSWNRDNPNTLTAQFSVGNGRFFVKGAQSPSSALSQTISVESKVTKRSFHTTSVPNTFDTTEFVRTTTSSSLSPVPIIVAHREMFRYKLAKPDTVDSLLIDNYYDPSNPSDTPPILTFKYYITMHKL